MQRADAPGASRCRSGSPTTPLWHVPVDLRRGGEAPALAPPPRAPRLSRHRAARSGGRCCGTCRAGSRPGRAPSTSSARSCSRRRSGSCSRSCRARRTPSTSTRPSGSGGSRRSPTSSSAASRWPGSRRSSSSPSSLFLVPPLPGRAGARAGRRARARRPAAVGCLDAPARHSSRLPSPPACRCVSRPARRRAARVRLRRRGGRDHLDVGRPVDAGAAARPRHRRRLEARAATTVKGMSFPAAASACRGRPDGPRRVRGCGPGRATATASPAVARLSAPGSFETAPAADRERHGPLRALGRRRRDPRPERQAGLQQLPGLRPHGGREERLQRQSRRHDLLGQRARRTRRPRCTVAEKWAEVQATAWRCPNLRSSARAAGLYSHWDDHEFINDFSRAEHRRARSTRRA